jgi:drug/metabolite transporter superfamily protein YnfA
VTATTNEAAGASPVDLGLETPLVATDFFRDGFTTAMAVTQFNNIAAFDGQAGTGKTTCARYVAQQLSRPCAVVTMPHKPAPLDILRRIHLAVTGVVLNDTHFRMQNELQRVLADWGGVLIVDEMQYTQANAMQELVWLYEGTGHAFALVVVGAGVLAATANYPQLHSRIMGQVVFQPLAGPALLTAVRALDPRLHDVPPDVLAAHDQRACDGLLRRWVQTIRWLNAFNVTGTASAEDLTAAAVKLPLMGRGADIGVVRRRRSK